MEIFKALFSIRFYLGRRLVKKYRKLSKARYIAPLSAPREAKYRAQRSSFLKFKAQFFSYLTLLLFIFSFLY